MDPDNTIITVILRSELARKLTGPWELINDSERVEIGNAMQHAVSWIPKSGPQESPKEIRRDLPA